MGCFNLERLYQKMQQMMSNQEEVDTTVGVKCIFCNKKERVLHFRQLSKGNHIQLNGENLRVNFGKKQWSPYTHHAIVKEVKIVSESEAELVLIEFIAAPFDSELKIRETKSIRSLRNDDIYIVRYRHDTHPPDKIIERAESFVELCKTTNPDLKYSLLSCNCEHFCNWCCTGNENSFQVHKFTDILKGILTGTANAGGKILRVALRVAYISADDLIKASTNAVTYLPWGAMSLLAIVYLIYCIYRHMKLNEDQKNGNICCTCCNRQKLDIWLRFLIYSLTQVGGLWLMTFIMGFCSSKGIIFGALALLITLTFGTMWMIPRLRNMICSSFTGKKVKVKSVQNIWIGDVISFRYVGLMHDAVVTRIFPDKRNDKKGKISVVHYTAANVFGRRKIVEEDIAIDLKRKTILGHVYDPKVYKCHPQEIVVERARQRIGETKFGVFSNRSCHFCHWAKVDEDIQDEDISEVMPKVVKFEYVAELSPLESFSRLQSLHVDHRPRRKKATKTLETSWARIRDDVKAGQLIQFKLHWRWHKAVVTDVRFNHAEKSKLSVTVVHYGKGRVVTEKTFTFDLNEVDIWIYRYHPLYRYRREDIIRRARARLGEKRYNMFTHNSAHLCEEIVEKDRDTMISHLGEIEGGDSIVFYYWSLKHAAVVAAITPSQAKDGKSGSVEVIHYSLQHLLGKRRITKETLKIDLNTDHVYNMKFEGCIRYPPSKIIENAKSRIGETRFSPFGNTSWDFVQWATVVQKPTIVVERVYESRPGLNKNQMSDYEEQRLLLPRIKNPAGRFQKVKVYTWNDLSPGDIIEYDYYWIKHQGIVSEIDAKRNEVKVIHYGACHIFAVREIMEDTLKINLKRSQLVVYRTDPRDCYKSHEIVARARRRLGEKDWKSGNRSWDMCLACVIKVGLRRSSSK